MQYIGVLNSFILIGCTFSQVPDPTSNHGSDGDPPLGNGAPIGGGLFILLGLGAAYGGVKIKKLYQLRKKKLLD